MSSAASSSTAPNVTLAAPDTHFVLSAQAGASARELLSKPRAEELLRPLTSDPAKAEAVSKLVLGGKSFGSDSAAVLAETLLTTHKLTHADFSDCIAGRNTEEALETLQLLCDGIAANERIQLTHLNLSDNALGVRGIPKIKNAFKNQVRKRARCKRQHLRTRVHSYASLTFPLTLLLLCGACRSSSSLSCFICTSTTTAFRPRLLPR